MTIIAILVWKFGGTALDDASKRAAIIERVQRFIKRGHRIVLVVSAIGRYPQPYATDSLLALTPHAAARQKDRMATLGETISSLILHSELLAADIPNEALETKQIGIITDECCGGAHIVALDASLIKAVLKRVPVAVVPGFQAVSRKGAITTLGRGGSDLTALVMAGALQLRQVSIFTDVNGIYDKDPRRYKDARHISRIRYDDMLQLCDGGAKVLYRKCVEVAKGQRIAIRVGCLDKGKRCSWVTDAG